MTQVKVRYHRNIMKDGKILYPSGTILDLDQVPGEQRDRVCLLDEEEPEESEESEAPKVEQQIEEEEPPKREEPRSRLGRGPGF